LRYKLVKRCPECNRIETDETLKFCRVDGAILISDSGSVSELGTARFVSGAVSSEIETSVLPHHTDADIHRPTAPTTVLPAAATPSTTSELTRPKRRGVVFGLIAVVVLGVAIGGYFYFSRKTASTIQSIAVMPFVNESGNADVEYLSDGMTETLINSLSQLPNLSVKARSTVFNYKGKAMTSQQVGAELSVQGVLNGRLLQHGDQLTLSLELVDARTGDQIWGEQYNRKTTDLVSLQSEIARDVSSKLKTKLSGADAAKVEKNYTTNVEAYQLYLKGKFYWNQRTGEALKQAVQFYQQAIEKDPNYALAYSGLAETYVLFSSYDVAPATDSMPQAKAAALRALEIDEQLAEAHTALGF
jgi:TolB-like protein